MKFQKKNLKLRKGTINHPLAKAIESIMKEKKKREKKKDRKVESRDTRKRLVF